jgi:hypothetical protein
VAAKALAARHILPPALGDLAPRPGSCQNLKGVRGPWGGYELARERRRITIGEIVRTGMSLSTADPEDLGSNSVLLERVIDPAVRRRGRDLSLQSRRDHGRTDVRYRREDPRARRREGQWRFRHLTRVRPVCESSTCRWRVIPPDGDTSSDGKRSQFRRAIAG